MLVTRALELCIYTVCDTFSSWDVEWLVFGFWLLSVQSRNIESLVRFDIVILFACNLDLVTEQ